MGIELIDSNLIYCSQFSTQRLSLRQIKSATMTQLLKPLIEQITKDPFVHAKWLNTLSYMENTGAKKISRFESKTDVNLLILKHAAEEHRHAYYLKKQISKLAPQLRLEPALIENPPLRPPRNLRYLSRKLVCTLLRMCYRLLRQS